MPSRGDPDSGDNAWGTVLLLALAVVFAVGALFWAPGEVAGRLASGRWPQVSILMSPGIAWHAISSPLDGVGGWPEAARRLIPGWLYYLLFSFELALLTAGVWCAVRLRERRRSGLPARLSWEDSSEQRIPRRHRL